ncbi:NUDIX hydrolase domain-like protein [Syncephalastrum racemosum]|uniref:NUDIX hydrolase domain-like protein n=1 Tax=Syncephalastrum racemosum TaxID=13706 RepID=A0A1X2HVV9_SYNRA|nr:NUDIX hydrolase domain-like protein [Syncephalastrum racemosum]
MLWTRFLRPKYQQSARLSNSLPSRALTSGTNESRLRHVASIIVKKNPSPSAGQIKGENNDTRCLDRISDQATYLVVRKPRKDNAWQFPQGGVDKDETVVQAALRELREECGQDIKVRLKDDNHPCGSYEYLYPPHFQRWADLDGNKVEYIRAEWMAGQCQPDKIEIVDFAWLTAEELKKIIESPTYKKSFENLLLF